MNLSDKNSAYTVSAVIPAYNAAEHIGRAIESVLAQTRPADEIIVVDDGSTDATRDEVAKFGNRIKYIYQKNAGAAVARNVGIKATRCEWIAFLDADDEWIHRKLELQIDHLKRNPELVWSYGNMYNCYCRQDSPKAAHNFVRADEIQGNKEYFDCYFSSFLEGFYASTITLIIKRAVLEKTGLFETGMPRGQDTDLWFRIAYRYPRIGYVNEPLATYHRGVRASITKTYAHSRVIGDLVEHHLKLSAEHDQLDKFRPCGSKMIQVLIREILDEERFDEITELVDRFESILPFRFKAEMRLRVRCPRTASFCLGVSARLKRFRSSISRPGRNV